MMTRLIIILVGCAFAAVASASSEGWPLDRAPINIKNKASLQRGAKYFVNYCQGCHSAKYIRYNQMAEGIGLVDAKGEVYKKLVLDNLVFVGDKITDPMLTTVRQDPAKVWFGGVAPPDLTLTARERGVDWLYTYLRSFYADPTRPLGVNNALFPSVSMPHVLLELQGVQKPVYKAGTESSTQPVLEKLELVQPGRLKPEEYDRVVADLVNFMSFIAEPMQLERKYLGIKVILFLMVLFVLAYLLKKEYWRDVH